MTDANRLVINFKSKESMEQWALYFMSKKAVEMFEIISVERRTRVELDE